MMRKVQNVSSRIQKHLIELEEFFKKDAKFVSSQWYSDNRRTLNLVYESTDILPDRWCTFLLYEYVQDAVRDIGRLKMNVSNNLWTSDPANSKVRDDVGYFSTNYELSLVKATIFKCVETFNDYCKEMKNVHIPIFQFIRAKLEAFPSYASNRIFVKNPKHIFCDKNDDYNREGFRNIYTIYVPDHEVTHYRSQYNTEIQFQVMQEDDPKNLEIYSSKVITSTKSFENAIEYANLSRTLNRLEDI